MTKILFAFSIDDRLLKKVKEKFGDDIEIVSAKKAEGVDEKLKEFDVLVTSLPEVKQETFERMGNLKWVQCAMAGINHLPLDYFREKDIILTNARGVHRVQMSEYTVGLLLAIVRRSDHYLKAQMKKKWDYVTNDELYGKTVGFLGVGAIAKETAKKLKAFDVRIIGVKNKVEEVEYFDEIYGKDQIDKVLEQSDYIITLLPLTDETYHIIGEEQFKKMKDTAWFINIARGSIVDEKALVKALQEGRIAGAGLDVFEQEPLPGDSPLWDMENVILTPHIAGPTPYYMERFVDVLLTNLEAYRAGKIEKMVNVVDYVRGY